MGWIHEDCIYLWRRMIFVMNDLYRLNVVVWREGCRLIRSTWGVPWWVGPFVPIHGPTVRLFICTPACLSVGG